MSETRFNVNGVNVGLLGLKLLETGRKDVKKAYHNARNRKQQRKISSLERIINEIKKHGKSGRYTEDDLPWLEGELREVRRGKI